MAKMQEFKCPCCGGSIEFDSSVQKMKCPFCDTEFDVGTLSEYAQTVEEEQPEDMSWSDEAGSEWQDGESEGLRTYVCKSCGGEIVGDANTAATACPFCGSPVVMTGQLSGALKPDYVIPFKLDKKAAKERLKKHLTGKRLLPKAFKSENHISEVKGIYVPFWLYDTTQMQISVTVQQRPGSGAIVIMIIRRPAIMQYIEVVLLVLIMYRWMALPAWKMI